MATYSEALAEAYASAPADEVLLDTIEARHPAFVEDGVPFAVRFVCDFDELVATLEPGAPLGGGTPVTFMAGYFTGELPEQSETSIPEMEITLDGVSREAARYLQLAIDEAEPLELTYRQFAASDLSAPQIVIPGLTARKGRVDVQKVTLSCQFFDLMNRPFPRGRYTPGRFPGLVR